MNRWVMNIQIKSHNMQSIMIVIADEHKSKLKSMNMNKMHEDIAMHSIEREENIHILFFIKLIHTISIITQLPLLFISSCMSYIQWGENIHWTSFYELF